MDCHGYTDAIMPCRQQGAPGLARKAAFYGRFACVSSALCCTNALVHAERGRPPVGGLLASAHLDSGTVQSCTGLLALPLLPVLTASSKAAACWRVCCGSTRVAVPHRTALHRTAPHRTAALQCCAVLCGAVLCSAVQCSASCCGTPSVLSQRRGLAFQASAVRTRHV